MSRKIIVVKTPSGMTRAMEFSCKSQLLDVFSSASKLFNLDEGAHELKIGPDNVNLNSSLEGSCLPETAVLEIVPKTEGTSIPSGQILVELCFSDEGDQYESYKKTMTSKDTLWDVIEELVPSHMTYADEDISLTYMGVSFVGKRKLSTVFLHDLCGTAERLEFACRRNYLQNAMNRKIIRKSAASPTPNPESRQKPSGCTELQKAISSRAAETFNPKVIHLSERHGRIYHGRLGTIMSKPSEMSRESLRSFSYQTLESNKICIRVVFPNAVVMEGQFSPTETIKDVTVFVDNYLVDNVKPHYLYTVQPKIIANPDKELGKMRSRPNGYLWCSGKYDGDSFVKQISTSLFGRVFSYTSDDNSNATSGK